MQKDIFKRYNLTLTELANILGYSSLQSFQTSTAYKKRIKSSEKLIQYIEDTIINRITS